MVATKVKIAENKTLVGNSTGYAEEKTTAVLPTPWTSSKVPMTTATEGTFEWKSVPVYHGELASAPSTFKSGDEYYNTGDSKFYKYNGTDWIALN